MRQLCLVLLAAMAALGPWIQGTGAVACCRSQLAVAAGDDGHGCCSQVVVEVELESGCCHSEPPSPTPVIDAPSAGCDCPHSAVQAVPVSVPRLDQVVDQAPVFALSADALPPRPARPEAIRCGRGPPPDHAPRAAAQYLRSQRLLI